PDLAALSAAFDALPMAIFVADGHTSIRFVNRALAALTGYSPSELVADSLILDSGLREILPGVLRSRDRWQRGWLCPRKSEPPFDARLSVAATSPPAGEPLLVATIEPMTPGERDFELFFNLIPDLACIAHKDGYFKRVNPAWERTLGYTP